MRHIADTIEEALTLRDENPDDHVLLDRGQNTTWKMWIPGRETPIDVPPGGRLRPRYSDGIDRG